MPIYRAPVDEVMFLLTDVLKVGRYDNLPGFADASSDVRAAILGAAAHFCEQVLAPLNRTGDKEGCTRHGDGSVTTPKGFKPAFKQYGDGGWMGISAPAELGGQGLPETLTVAVNEMMGSANMAFSMYAALTQGALSALIRHGTPEQKAAYVPKMVAGLWTGTMNLTEPHCGTDLGLLRTKAVRQGDGSYKLTGTKILPPPASTICPRTSCISCSRASRVPSPASAAYRCSSYRKFCRRPTDRWANATASPAARSKTRWASTPTRPAS